MAISSNATGLRPGVCTSTTRPTTPYTGQIIYETDTGYLRVWDGSAWDYLSQKQDYTAGLTTGKILQVSSVTKTNTFTTTSTTFTDVTDLSLTITPNASTNKILLVATLMGTGETNQTGIFFRFVRDSTAIAIADSAGSRIRATGVGRDAQQMQSVAMTHLDSPNTTSAVTYKVQVQTQGAGSVYVNRITTDTDASSNSRAVSTFTVLEVVA